MSKAINNSHDLLPSNIEEIRLDGTEKELQRNPFLRALSKITTLFKKEQVKSQEESQQEPKITVDSVDSTKEQYYYTQFTDRVDPSIYYTIFLSQKCWNSDQ